MAAVSIWDLDDEVKARLRVRAAQHGRSMEAEIRAILSEAVGGEARDRGLAGSLLDTFAGLGGVELDLPPRTDHPRGADLSR